MRTRCVSVQDGIIVSHVYGAEADTDASGDQYSDDDTNAEHGGQCHAGADRNSHRDDVADADTNGHCHIERNL